MNSKYLIIADDFTGANDTGVQMRKRGIQTDVVLYPNEDITDSSIVLDTESRHLSKNDAYNKVSKMYRKLIKKNKFKFVYKKIDSTLRGNVIDEMQAIIDIYNPEKIIFAPSFPDIGRVVKEKIHYVNNKRLLKTEFAEDPLSPITNDNIKNLLEESIDESIEHHSISSIRKSNFSLKNKKYHTFDAVTNEDLLKIVKYSIKQSNKILWVGSAGLANALFTLLKPKKPVLSVVGSISEVSFKQLDYAEKNGKEIIVISPKDIFKKEDILKYVNKINNLLNENNDVILTSARSRKDYEDTIKLGRKHNLTEENSSWYVKNYISSIAKEVIKNNKLSGIFLTGGDTAISVIDKLEAHGSRIESELFTGIILSSIKGGKFENLKLVTKAGAFGTEKSLLDSINTLKEL